MTQRLAGKTALVTAAGQGIGRATAEAFAREGASVIATDINADLLADLGRVPGVTAKRLDVTDANAVNALAHEIGAINVLFNGAGFVHAGTILDCDEAAWDFSFDLNVRSMYRLIRATLPGMLAQGQGSIINVSSLAGPYIGASNNVYAAAKAGVVGLTKALAQTYGPHGIRANCIAPGLVETGLVANILADDTIREGYAQGTPLRKLGQPEDIARVALFLASDDSAFLTGTLIPADAGYLVR